MPPAAAAAAPGLPEGAQAEEPLVLRPGAVGYRHPRASAVWCFPSTRRQGEWSRHLLKEGPLRRITARGKFQRQEKRMNTQSQPEGKNGTRRRGFKWNWLSFTVRFEPDRFCALIASHMDILWKILWIGAILIGPDSNARPRLKRGRQKSQSWVWWRRTLIMELGLIWRSSVR